MELSEERKRAGRGDLWKPCGAILVSLLGGQSTQIDVHRANGTLPADRYAEYTT